VREIEVKILEIDRRSVEETLSNLKAAKVFDGNIETFFYDFRDRSILKAKNVMRLRLDGRRIELTYKKVSKSREAKIANEYTISVSDLGTTKKILKSLGLLLIESMRKHRISYQLGRTRFDIDRFIGQYGGIPEFLEIESNSLDSIHKYAKLLGYKSEDCLPWSTEQLIQHYAIKH